MEAAGRGIFPGSLSVPGVTAQGPLHPSAAPRGGVPRRRPRDGLVLGHRGLSRPFGGQPRPRHPEAGPSAKPRPRRCRRTRGEQSWRLPRPQGTSPSPGPPGQGCPSPGRGSAPSAPRPGSRTGGSSGALPGPAAAGMLRRRPGTHLWVQRSRGGLRGGILPAAPAPPGQTPALRLEGAPLLPPLHPPPPPPGRSPALARGDAAGSSPSPLGARGPPAPPAAPHGASPRPGARTWGR